MRKYKQRQQTSIEHRLYQVLGGHKDGAERMFLPFRKLEVTEPRPAGG